MSKQSVPMMVEQTMKKQPIIVEIVKQQKDEKDTVPKQAVKAVKETVEKIVEVAKKVAPVTVDKTKVAKFDGSSDSGITMNPISFLVGLFAAWLSWQCNEHKQLPERIIRASLAFFFNIIYIAWYYIAGGLKGCTL